MSPTCRTGWPASSTGTGGSTATRPSGWRAGPMSSSRTGPGCTAGPVRGDVLLAFGGTPVASAVDLTRAVARARPGQEVSVTVRHLNGTHRRLTVVPGVVA
nr:PDZ domain-containing protein [Streptomyces sp. NTH33]